MKKGWETKTLDAVVDLVMGQAPPSKDCNLEGRGTPFVKVGEFGSDRPVIREWTTNPLRLARKSDVLLCVVGATCGKINLGEDCAIGRSVAAIRPNTSRLNQYYLYYFMMTLTERLRSGSVGAAQTVISKEMINSVEVPLPTLHEQQRIVTLLDEAFDGIATAKANAEANLKSARELFESHLYGVNAKTVPLGEMVKITTGKLDANAAVDGGQYPFFTCSREIYAIDHHAFDTEAILLAGNNAVGDFNVKHYKGKFNAYQRTYVITVNEPTRVLYRFLYFQMLKSLKKFKEQSVGAGTKFLKIGMIKDLEITLPSLVEQAEIVSTVDSLREEAQRLEEIYQQKLTALDDLKKSLLHQAFSGQL